MYVIEQYFIVNKLQLPRLTSQLKIKHVLQNKNKANLVYVHFE